MTKDQLKLYVKINFLILSFFIVLFIIYYLNKKGLPEKALSPLQLRPATVVIPEKASSDNE